MTLELQKEKLKNINYFFNGAQEPIFFWPNLFDPNVKNCYSTFRTSKITASKFFNYNFAAQLIVQHDF